MGAEWIGWKFVKRKMKVSQDGTSQPQEEANRCNEVFQHYKTEIS